MASLGRWRGKEVVGRERYWMDGWMDGWWLMMRELEVESYAGKVTLMLVSFLCVVSVVVVLQADS